MYQTIHEQISVAGVYNQGKFSLRKFLWRQQEYTVDQVTLISNAKDGGVVLRYYSILSKHNVYRLLFNITKETWYIEEIWIE